MIRLNIIDIFFLEFSKNGYQSMKRTQKVANRNSITYILEKREAALTM